MHDFEEHIKNLASLQRRLTSLGCVIIFFLSHFRLKIGKRIPSTRLLILVSFLGGSMSLMKIHPLGISYRKFNQIR